MKKTNNGWKLSEDGKYKVYRLFKSYKDPITKKYKNASKVIRVSSELKASDLKNILADEKEQLRIETLAKSKIESNINYNVTFNQYADDWLIKNSNTYSSSHQYTVLNMVNYLKEYFGKMLLKDIDRKAIKEMILDRFNTPITREISKLKVENKDKLRELIIKKFSTIVNFTKISGISDTTLKVLLNGSNVYRTSAEKVCKALTIRYSTYFNNVETITRTRVTQTVKKYIHILSAILNDALDEELIDNNFSKVTYYKKLFNKRDTHREITAENVFDYEEMIKFSNIIQKLDEVKKAYFMICLYSGARRSEVLGLTWDDIDFKNNRMYINKSLHVFNNRNDIGASKIYEKYRMKYPMYNKNKTLSNSLAIGPAKWERERNFPMSDILIKTLLEYRKFWQEEYKYFENKMPGNFLFWNIRTNNWFYPDTVDYWFNKIYTKYSAEMPKKITLHGLRHTFITVLLTNGVPIKTVSLMAGHRSIEITLNTYNHFIKDDEKYLSQINNVFNNKLQ